MRKSYLLLPYLFVLAFFSCQDETETIRLNTQNSFAKSSPITSLISRVSQYETTDDNVLDGTSNCSIKLPAHVTVNGQYVYVISAADFQTVQDIKNLSSTDDDIVHFGFPITIVYPNYQEHDVANETEFETILAEYGDDSLYHNISCINFNYPISINIYNSNNQVASSVTLQNDNQLYTFVNNLIDGEIVGFVFPITLTNSDGDTITVANNSQLESAIESVIDDCSSTSSGTLILSDVLTSGSWYVSYYYGDGNDQTNYYNGYNFTFNPNGNCTAIKNSIITDGDWDIHDESGGYHRLDLHFDGSALDEMEEGWKVLEFTATSIRLKDESGDGSDNHYLNFTKN
ncbi:hypothetical protein L1S35_00365 [Flavobacterium sp. AS60]|uniref:hypothetical protein n=1 Tax=Flavobacterium anseongense TaxID=2910677 RepID=UPI001F322967|nr:hypothetical protein [Flavobacterium sp. AS60]MCF6128111.1 hypothetical protein [Flavobacterium sp. AS60]